MEKLNSRRIVCSKRMLPADPNISKEIYLFAGMTTVFITATTVFTTMTTVFMAYTPGNSRR